MKEFESDGNGGIYQLEGQEFVRDHWSKGIKLRAPAVITVEKRAPFDNLPFIKVTSGDVSIAVQAESIQQAVEKALASLNQ